MIIIIRNLIHYYHQLEFSQQRTQEAIEALLKSWELFKLKNLELEEMANNAKTDQQQEAEEEEEEAGRCWW